MTSLDRFKQAQDQPHSGFETALAEIRSGRKRSHWIWYVFPQLAGLGRSTVSRAYAIRDLQEAIEYLRDPTLRSRFLAITRAVKEAIAAGQSLGTVMGSSIDVTKLVSSLTLFGSVAAGLFLTEDLEEYGQLARVAEDVLAAANREGYTRCEYTLAEIVPPIQRFRNR